MLIVITLLGIAAGLALPAIGDTRTMRLRAAARILAADLEFAQTESIAHGNDPRLVKFDAAGNRYWIALVSKPGDPIPDPLNAERDFAVTLGEGRASAAAGVTIHSLDLDGDDELKFDAYGSPDQADAAITLAGGGLTLTVRVAAGSGEVSVDPVGN